MSFFKCTECGNVRSYDSDAGLIMVECPSESARGVLTEKPKKYRKHKKVSVVS